MKVIGLTGGIATGKSKVSTMLKELGAVIIDADMVARNILETGLPAWEKVKNRFGEEYLLPDGQINRLKLGNLVFSDTKALSDLNSITHPFIRDNIKKQIDELKTQGYEGVVVVDAALLLEVGWDTMVDQVWVVTAESDQQIQRLMARNNFTKEQAISRIKSQMSQKERMLKADKIIENTQDIRYTREQVEALWLTLQ